MTILQATVPVIENVRLARDTYRLRFGFPALAGAIRPGQFLMLRVPGRTDPLLGRAFALYDTVPDADVPVAVDIVYLVVGKMTRLMAGLNASDLVEVWGPLGNGFRDYRGCKHLHMVAGGIGQTPFLALIRQVLGTRGYGGSPPAREVERVSVYYGVRSADLLAGVDEFRSAGAEVHLATDDGSTGFHGFVTQLLGQVAGSDRPAAKPIDAGHTSDAIVGCGPEPMMHALATLAERWRLPCDLSLETPMACGVGICFSCVAKVKTPDGWDYRRVCVDGPVFDAADLEWQ